MEITFEHRLIRATATLAEGDTERWARGRRVRRARPTRVFVSENESVLENLVLRTSRPIELYREFAERALTELFGAHGVALRWDRKAGCSMCPCSPGFVLVRDGRRQARTDTGFVDVASLDSFAVRYDLFVSLDERVTAVDDAAEFRADQLGVDLAALA
jgi:hypothetical protein